MWKINDDFLSDTKAVFSKQIGFSMEMQMANIHCAILTKNTHIKYVKCENMHVSIRKAKLTLIMLS